MKNLLYFILLPLIAFSLSSCEKEIGNPGDFTLRSELKVLNISDTLGNDYPVKIIREIDTTYMYQRILRDTLRDEHGELIYNEFNQPTINYDTIMYSGDITGRYYELESITLGSTRNEVHIEVQSNARWFAPSPIIKGIAWMRTLTASGGGDAKIKSSIPYNGLPEKRRPEMAVQYIYTTDSLNLFKLSFDQKARNEE